MKVGGLCTEHALAGELQTLEPVDPRQQLAPVFWRACSIMTMAIRELLFRNLDISQTSKEKEHTEEEGTRRSFEAT